MMLKFLTLVLLLFASGTAYCAANAELLPVNIRAKFHGPSHRTPNFTVCRADYLVLTGQLLPPTADFVSDCLVRNKTTRTLYVDLVGGDVATALSIAKALEEFEVEVVVDGRCFSACADYLIPAAKKIRILAGSLVGIHDRRFQRFDRNGNGVIEDLTPAELGKWGPDAVTRYHTTEKARRAFLYKYGRSEPFHEIYQRYLERRKNFLWGKANGSFLCPVYEMWVLDTDQLKAFGIRDIDDQWAPSSQRQVDAISKSLRHTERLFFGTAKSMDRQCTFAGVIGI
jgi:hypothetical protein